MRSIRWLTSPITSAAYAMPTKASITQSSVSDYIATVAPDVDTQVRNLIDECISKIETIPEPFANHATGNEADAAMESLGNLSKALAKVNTALLQN